MMGAHSHSIIKTMAAIILTTALLGCSRTPAVKYYTLRAAPNPAMESRDLVYAEGPVVGFGPVRIPDYLDRFQLVTRSGSDTLEISDFHKWAEPLPGGIVRIVARNLSALLPQTLVVGFPWRQSVSVRYRIPLEILRFEGVSGKDVKLLARWRIYDKKDERIVLARESYITVGTANRKYETVVAAQSKALEKLSEDIAAALRELKQP